MELLTGAGLVKNKTAILNDRRRLLARTVTPLSPRRRYATKFLVLVSYIEITSVNLSYCPIRHDRF